MIKKCKFCGGIHLYTGSIQTCPAYRRMKKFLPKIKQHFSGSSPPEVFVGRYGYPKIFTGILSPTYYGDTSRLGSVEEWFKERASIEQIMQYRAGMIYSRFQSSIKDARKSARLLDTLKETALASRSVGMEFFLRKRPHTRLLQTSYYPSIGNPAPLKKARLEENPRIERKVDYLTADTDMKAEPAVQELYKSGIKVSNIIKILSSGQLGVRIQRKLVPTRWSITASDDIISRKLLERVKQFPFINEFQVFHEYYIGNHYEILLMPRSWAFEVMEAKMPGSVWNSQTRLYIMKDYESAYKRKRYASEVTGAYYANRLAVCEHLLKQKRQASALVLREVRPEYYLPCGVGILREATRAAFNRKPRKFHSMQEALTDMQSRMKLPIETFLKQSKLLTEHTTQRTLAEFP